MTNEAKTGPAKKRRRTEGPSRAAPKGGGARPPEPGAADAKLPETGGRGGPDPTRYGDWEKGGRCVDF